MRVVLDCNVVIAAARPGGVCRTVLLAVARQHELVSMPILEEYRSVASRPKHGPYHRTMLVVADLMERIGLLVDPHSEPPFGLSDADDEVYLGTALAGQAEILVTGNRRHFPKPR